MRMLDAVLIPCATLLIAGAAGCQNDEAPTLDTTSATTADTAQQGDDASVSDTASETTVIADTTDTTDASTRGPGTAALIALMQSKDGKRYNDSLADGVQYVPSADGMTFYAVWTPPGFDPKVNGFLVSLPGHDAFASSAYAVWKPYLVARKYGFVGLQWWLGSGEATSDYLYPDEIHREFAEALAARGVTDRRVLFEGFSRGSANSYAVTAIDHASATPYFLLTIANSGGAASDYPPNQQIDAGAFGAMPFAETDWVLYCGEKDPDPQHSGCPAMTATKSWLEAKGAKVDLFIEDPLGDHGGFNLDAGNADEALDAYEALWSW